MKPDELPFTTVDGPTRPDATEFRCPLCAARFTHAQQACPTCPLNAGCSLVTCPNCDYAFPRTSRVVRWFQRLGGLVRREGRRDGVPGGPEAS